MPRATNHATTFAVSRRNLAGFGAALLALGGDAAAASAAEPDAQLIRLCREFDVLEQATDAFTGQHPSGSAAERAEDAERAKLVAQQEELVDRIVALPCQTSAGVYALGRSLAGYLSSEELEDEQNYDMEGRLLAAMLRAITRGQVRPAASASVLPAPAISPVSSPDAALLALVAEYIALDRRFIAIGDQQGDRRSDDPVWLALDRQSRMIVPELHRLEQEISDTPARTPEGIRAKAKATRHMLAAEGDAATEPMNDEAVMAWSLVEDLLRVT